MVAGTAAVLEAAADSAVVAGSTVACSRLAETEAAEALVALHEAAVGARSDRWSPSLLLVPTPEVELVAPVAGTSSQSEVGGLCESPPSVDAGPSAQVCAPVASTSEPNTDPALPELLFSSLLLPLDPFLGI